MFLKLFSFKVIILTFAIIKKTKLSLHEISCHCRHALLAVKPRGLIR